MGIYIKNKEMPKNCYTCTFKIIDPTDGSVCGCVLGHIQGIPLDQDRADDCPLEEIDLVRCKECKRCEERTTLNGLPFLYCLKMEVSVGSNQYCYWGERRNDE